MNSEQIKKSDRILKGIKFLVGEAERNGFDKIAQILRSCARDLRIAIRTQQKPQGDNDKDTNSQT